MPDDITHTASTSQSQRNLLKKVLSRHGLVVKEDSRPKLTRTQIDDDGEPLLNVSSSNLRVTQEDEEEKPKKYVFGVVCVWAGYSTCGRRSKLKRAVELAQKGWDKGTGLFLTGLDWLGDTLDEASGYLVEQGVFSFIT